MVLKTTETLDRVPVVVSHEFCPFWFDSCWTSKWCLCDHPKKMPGGYMDTHLEDAICLGNQRKDEVEQTRRYKYLRFVVATTDTSTNRTFVGFASPCSLVGLRVRRQVAHGTTVEGGKARDW